MKTEVKRKRVKAKNRVRVTKINYVINPESKVVICLMDCDLQLFTHPSSKDMYDIVWKKKFPNIGWNGTFSVKGIARCNNEDPFNEEMGKKIAESRAKMKAFSIAQRIYQEIFYHWTNLANSVKGNIEACAQTVKVEEYHINDLINQL